MLLTVACLLVPLGCTPPPRPPAPEHLRVAAAASLTPLVERLASVYHARYDYVTVETSERGAEAALKAVAEGEADLAFIERDLAPAEAINPATGKAWLRAWPAATGALAIVVHPSNPVQGLTQDQVRQAFAGTQRRWSSLGGMDRTVQVVSREIGAPLRDALEQEALRGSRVIGTAVVMPTDAAVAEYVAEHPEAIGYMSAAWPAEGVRALAVDGAPPDPDAVAAGRYPLSYPLVVVTPTAISGKAKAFVDFINSHEGQAILDESYAPALRTGN